MSPTPPTRPPKSLIGAVTQAVQSIQTQTQVFFSKLKLKPGARVPELWVQDAGADQAEIFPLLGDRYVLGRSSKSCDIVIRNPVVSQVHLSLNREKQPPGFLGYFWRSPFVMQDENSTNGIFRGKRRVRKMVLRHGDVYTLGPPELADAVRVKYNDPPPPYVKAFRYGVYGIGGLSALVAAITLMEWQKVQVTPLPNSVQGPVMILARDGETVISSPIARTHSEMKSLQEFSSYLPKALIASEDSRFYWHFGVDPVGVLRAMVANFRGGTIREGASTLTQQLARSIFRAYVGTEDSAGRKLREAAVALKLETFYSKDFLLLTYLNRVYMGSGAYGFEDAAQFYLNKSAKDLTLSEAAMLVGILPAPNRFNPVRDYQKAMEQRDGVLKRMLEMGMISSEAYQQARRSRININPKAKEELESIRAPYYQDQVYADLESLLGADVAKEGNFIVETGLDPAMQAEAEASLRNAVSSVGVNAGFSQGAIVTLDAKTGEVLALVGGVDYKQSQFNRATQAYRQPGSTFKIFAYTTALQEGISPGTAFSCAPLNWEGQYFEGCRSGGGSLDMYSAIAQSENAVALRVAQEVGLDRVAQTAKRMGIQSDLKAVPGLVLGQSETTVLEMTGAFGVLADGGIRNYPRTIRRILDAGDCQDRKNFKTCRVIYSIDQDTEQKQPVIKPEIANTMTDLLRGVVTGGTGRSAAIGMGEVGKTGTTNDNVDLWFIGYIPGQALVTGIWLGNDNNTPTSGSSAQAAQLWGNYMSRIVN
ncbi:PBP1A family penicillin-binding protein [Leptodesmis sichuanensis]|uniref:PBP1A family penicillin-binding protein n=1 Tax=Leptodesmis sichuanensis TaxID=2906798 RepID=UPI001F456162|nr:PBP1A family penicillin-binding protein [Leptodesmis sichuanensis]UIE38944.1 PBP1A family penicillin-binding protein [Leptodesmis sichuanensis A121]